MLYSLRPDYIGGAPEAHSLMLLEKESYSEPPELFAPLLFEVSVSIYKVLLCGGKGGKICCVLGLEW